MKGIVRIVTLVMLLMTLAIGSTSAQGRPAAGNQKITREQLAEVQARHIAKQLALDEATTQRLVNVYGNCQKEIWALGPRMGKRGQGSANETDIKARFERSQKILNIREKYYGEYCKFLSQKQIQRVYEIEKQMMQRMRKHRGQGQPRQRKR